MSKYADFWGEAIGTFILVLFGCGSVAVTVLFSAHVGLFQVAVIWGLGVTLAIYATRHLSCAHLNPAVSIAMVVGRRMSLKRLPVYVSAQFIGAFIAAGVLYLLFSSSLVAYESAHGIIRGAPGSAATAMMFGEFYPNPGSGPSAAVSSLNAFFAEATGTFMLVLLIFALTDGCNLGGPGDALSPVFIGLSVTVIISIISPLTQAGLNPARDLSPRLFAYVAGWGAAALPDRHFGFLTIYVLGPICGATISALIFDRYLKPLMRNKMKFPSCTCGENIEEVSRHEDVDIKP